MLITEGSIFNMRSSEKSAPPFHSFFGFAKLLLSLFLVVTHAVANSAEYEIDPAKTQLYWLVYSSGALAGLGHNHVISAPEIQGRIDLQDTLSDSTFMLEIPVDSLQVDAPALRSTLGQPFASRPSQRDIEATRRNMLSRALLDSEAYPTISVAGSAFQSEGGSQTLQLTLTVKGTDVEMILPLVLDVEEDRIAVKAQFQLTHQQLGLRPFSALFGALQVAEHMDFVCVLVARRVVDGAE
jgi:hypothetical protein